MPLPVWQFIGKCDVFGSIMTAHCSHVSHGTPALWGTSDKHGVIVISRKLNRELEVHL